MNWNAFWAMLAHDFHVARRDFVVLLLQTCLQPMMFVFVFGHVMVRSGYIPETYKCVVLPGIMAITMLFTGIWTVAMPLIAEFGPANEIEDRLLAPIAILAVAAEKVLLGTLHALVTGIMVIPAAWLILRPVQLNWDAPLALASVMLLVSLLSASIGLTLGCSIHQRHIGIMFTMILPVIVFFGCTYYPWSALTMFPVLQQLLLVNPVLYASEGLRGALIPQSPHLSLLAVSIALSVFDTLLLFIGFRQFCNKAVG